MTIGGRCPWVMHGEALAVVYPEFTRLTYAYAIERFAIVGRIFNPELAKVTDQEAARQSCIEIDQFLWKTGMWLNLSGLNVTEE